MLEQGSLVISEIFHSLQGEGSLVGVPSVFVRTSGCNLRCHWCDTPYTSWTPEGTRWSLEQILEQVAAYRAVRHAVITGGEPLLAPDVGELIGALRGRGFHVTVETAGTRYLDATVDLWSVSPKLSSSTPGPEAGSWHREHEARRLDLAVLRRFVAAPNCQWKFVVGSLADVREVDALVETLAIRELDRVILMPEARTPEELTQRQTFVAEACRERGYRFGDRLHLRLYGARRGT